MEFTVNVDKIDLNDQLNSYYDEDGDRISGGTFGDAIAEKLISKFAKSDEYKGLAARVRTIRDEEIRALLLPVLTEAMQGPIATTNTYGEPSGKTTTLRELIMAEAQRAMTQRGDTYSSDKSTFIQKIVRAAVEDAFKAEIAAAVKEAKAAVVTQMGTTVGTLMSDAVREAMRVRT